VSLWNHEDEELRLCYGHGKRKKRSLRGVNILSVLLTIYFSTHSLVGGMHLAVLVIVMRTMEFYMTRS